MGSENNLITVSKRMPWNWDGRGRKSIEAGGTVGSVAEAQQSKTWPTYEAAYLASRLGGHRAKEAAQMDKYAAASTFANEAAQQVYLSKISANYKQEADECLKQEFSQWLQGKHDLNDASIAYANDPNSAQRRFVFRDQHPRNAQGGGVGPLGHDPGDKMDDWRPTWWGRGTLTHLPGVRDYLRSQAEPSNDEELALNVLAEFGPQNIDQAWMYFKHWVKGRPLSEATCLTKTAHAHDDQQDVSRTNAPSDSFYKAIPPTSKDNYKFDDPAIQKLDGVPADGRPPTVIERFCVGTEPCKQDDDFKTLSDFNFTPSNSSNSSNTTSSNSSTIFFNSNPDRAAYFNSYPPPGLLPTPRSTPSPIPEDPENAQPPPFGGAGGIPVNQTNTTDDPLFDYDENPGLNCAQWDQAIQAKNKFESEYDQIRANATSRMRDLFNDSADEDSAQRARAELELEFRKLQKLNQSLDEMPRPVGVDSTINDAVDDAGFTMNESLTSAFYATTQANRMGVPPTMKAIVNASANTEFVPNFDVAGLSKNSLLMSWVSLMAYSGIKLNRIGRGLQSCDPYRRAGTPVQGMISPTLRGLTSLTDQTINRFVPISAT